MAARMFSEAPSGRRWSSPGAHGLVAGLLCLPFACAQPKPPPANAVVAVPAPDSGQVTVIILPGVEGNRWQLFGVRAGLRDAGMAGDIEILRWNTPPLWSLINLTDLAANRRRARRFAEHVAEARRRHPDRPLTLVGFSGGGGLALMTVERLPDGIDVDQLVLCAAAISPRYDLSRVQPRVRGKIVNFFSPHDGIVGWGTAALGTIDREKTVSAGHCGFLDDAGALRAEPWLVQRAWCEEWQRHGHHGGHIDYLSRTWAREVLARDIARMPGLSEVAPSAREAGPSAGNGQAPGGT